MVPTASAPIAVKILTPNVWRRCRLRLDVFHALRENLSSEDHFRTKACYGLANLLKRKLGRRDATGFKKPPHLDDFLLWRIAMCVRECSRTSIEHHTNAIH